MYSIIRYVIFISLFIVCIIILKKHNRLNKKAIVASVIVFVVLLEASFFMPVENLFVKFPTVESVYRYMGFNNKSIEHIIDGEKTAFIADRDNKKQYLRKWYIILKADDGYKINVGRDESSISMISECAVSLTTDKRTGDTYIVVISNDTEPLVLEDSNHSDFVLTNIDSIFGYEYTAFVGNTDENYRLTVNGTTYKFEKEINNIFKMVPVQ